jgi:hypothetical protein
MKGNITSIQEKAIPSSSGIEPLNAVSGDQPISSRCTLSEEGRKAKERFLEKEREMVRTEAKKRKLEGKKAKENILMQIADDREMRKVKNVVKTETASIKDRKALTSGMDVCLK